MYTLTSFRRRLVFGDVEREVELAAGATGWLPAQQHHGENIGDTSTHVIFVELVTPQQQAEALPMHGLAASDLNTPDSSK